MIMPIIHCTVVLFMIIHKNGENWTPWAIQLCFYGTAVSNVWGTLVYHCVSMCECQCREGGGGAGITRGTL